MRTTPSKYCTLILVCLFFIKATYGQDSVMIHWLDYSHSPVTNVDSNFFIKSKIKFGYLRVPESRQRPDKYLNIAIAKLSCLQSEATQPTLIMLHGGPGGKIIEKFNLPNALRQDRDIVVLDQRGCGYSQPDFTTGMNQDILNILSRNLTRNAEENERIAVAEKWKRELKQRNIDLSAYTTNNIAKDVNDLCTALHLTSWDLWGTSYGTRVALTLMKSFPQGIHSVILESPLAANTNYIQNITKNFKSSLEKLFEKCDENPEVHKKYPNLRSDFTNAINAIEKNPIVVDMNNSDKYPNGKFIINSQDILLGLQQSLYGKSFYPVFPLLVEELKNRDAPGLRNFIEGMSNGIFRLQYGLYYSVMCEDCIPSNGAKAFDSTSADFWGGVSFYRDEFGICNVWSDSSKRIIDSAQIRSNIPTLILSGELDPIASTKGALMTQKGLSSAYLYTFKNTGHFAVDNDSTLDLLINFLNRPKVEPSKNHFIETENIKFITNIYHNPYISIIPNDFMFSKKNWLHITGVTIMILCLLIGLIILIASRNSVNIQTQSFFAVRIAFVLNFIIALAFVILTVTAISRTMSRNFFLIGFGVDDSYAFIFFLPYVFLFLLAFSCICIYFQHNTFSKKNLILLCLLQVPFLIFCWNYHLFY